MRPDGWITAGCSKRSDGYILDRSYFETGKFLSGPNNNYKELNGQSASYYPEKAKTMFEEMDLLLDLEEYKKYIKGRAYPNNWEK